jgi:hypothetical protein
LRTAAVAALLCSAARADGPPSEPGLEKGKEELASGRYEAAITTLTAVVVRLNASPDRDAEAAIAYLHLGVAYAGLGQLSSAKSQFVQALMRDPSLDLDPKATPKATLDVFKAARREGESEGVVSSDRRARKVAPRREGVRRAPPPDRIASAGKIGSARMALIAVGVIGAAVGVTAVATGSEKVPPPQVQTFVPVIASPFIQLVSSQPGPGSMFPSRTTVGLTVKAVNVGTSSANPRLFLVARALTADGRACLGGESLPFSFLPGDDITYGFPLRAQCTAPFTTESLELSLQDPETNVRPYQATYRGGYSVTP